MTHPAAPLEKAVEEARKAVARIEDEGPSHPVNCCSACNLTEATKALLAALDADPWQTARLEAEAKLAEAEEANAEVHLRFARLLDRLTDGRMSKTNYSVEVMEQEIDAAYERWHEQGRKDTAALDADRGEAEKALRPFAAIGADATVAEMAALAESEPHAGHGKFGIMWRTHKDGGSIVIEARDLVAARRYFARREEKEVPE